MYKILRDNIVLIIVNWKKIRRLRKIKIKGIKLIKKNNYNLHQILKDLYHLWNNEK